MTDKKFKQGVIVLDPQSPTFAEDLAEAIEFASSNGNSIETVGMASVAGDEITLESTMTLDGMEKTISDADIVSAIRKSEELRESESIADAVKELENVKGITVLRMSSPTFIEDFEKAVGHSFETTTFSIPQFERDDGIVPKKPPSGTEQWLALVHESDKTLKELGLCRWDKTERGVLWVYPKEWYSAIPAGLPLVPIDYEETTFVPGKTDNDHRYGCLAYGFLKPEDGTLAEDE